MLKTKISKKIKILCIKKDGEKRLNEKKEHTR